MMFRLGVFEDPRVIGALRAHHDAVRAGGAWPGVDLRRPDVRFWSAWDRGALLAIGAWRRLDAIHGEVTAVYVMESLRRRGLGGQMLSQLVDDARAGGARRLWLETGAGDHFRPVTRLFARRGFSEAGPFAGRRPRPDVLFMTLSLDG
ncbi:GNAT family N-acetyltransferase [Camelimonas abortus]|uniref:GNAT family N-acetyltransferase n=1 Tax=Camelimonas abortus TaxID=1017184 RepID=A0ABV7LAZ2_9HYPH